MFSNFSKRELFMLIGILVFFVGLLFFSVNYVKTQDYTLVYGTAVDKYTSDSSYRAPRVLKDEELKIKYSYKGTVYEDFALCVLEFKSVGDSIGVYAEQSNPGVIHSKTELFYAPFIMMVAGFFLAAVEFARNQN